MKHTPLFLVFALLFISFGCSYNNNNTLYYKGYFPDSAAINFSEINSQYDDINSALLQLHSYNYIAFSSNEPSNGSNYDIKGSSFTFVWDQRQGSFYIDDNVYSDMPGLAQMLKKTRTHADEYGPYFITDNKDGYFFYACNQTGTNTMHYYKYGNIHETGSNSLSDSLISGPYQISFLSSDQCDQGYISFRTLQFPYDHLNVVPDSAAFESMVYCNNSGGLYNIYEIDIPKSLNLYSFIESENNFPKNPIDAVNSEHNDKCPNVCGNFMVFSSDRPGGLGGFDFYYSIYQNGQWSDPVNFGKPINSQYDEYRAIAIKSYSFENDLLIFSSNRPGGYGGYDIYYIGIDVMPKIENN